MTRYLARHFVLLVALLALVVPGHAPALAQTSAVPYWASLSAEEVNLRVGPSERFRITWVYRRVGLPVKVLRLQQGWRLIEEQDGTRGWVFNQLLSGARTAVVSGGELAPMRDGPEADAQLLWNLAPGVIGQLGECRQGFCRLDVDGRAGWVAAGRLWGAQEP